jgi:hypothetical protein
LNFVNFVNVQERKEIMKVEEVRNLLIENNIKSVVPIRHGSGLIKFIIHDPKRKEMIEQLKLIFPEIITDESMGMTNLYHK